MIMDSDVPIPYLKQAIVWKQSKRLVVKRSAFSNECNDDNEEENQILLKKRRKNLLKVNCDENISKTSKTLKEEGSLLAEKGKYEEALKTWSEAILLTPEDETLFEMQSQVLMIMEKDFSAVQQGEKCTKIKKNWWIGWQTLGRAQLNLHDIDMAVNSFSRASHLAPWETDLVEVDLRQAVHSQEKLKCDELC